MAASSFDDESEHFAQRDYSKPYPVPVPRVIPSYPSVTERYFDVRFFVPLAHVAENKNAGDQCILFHTNRICMITLAPHHPLLPNNNFGIESVTKNSEITSSSSTSNESNVNPFDPLSWQSFVANASKRTIESIDFTNGTELNLDEEVTTLNAQKHNRLLNTVTGKRKKGGQKLKERSIICQVKCTDGSIFSILAGIKGTLVEINEALLTQPNLLIEEPWSRGYVAIILTPITRVNRLKDLLTSSDKYYKEVAERKCKVTNKSSDESSTSKSSNNFTCKQVAGDVTNEQITRPISSQVDLPSVSSTGTQVEQEDADGDDVESGTGNDINDDDGDEAVTADDGNALDTGNFKKLKR